MKFKRRQYACGVVCLSTNSAIDGAANSALADELARVSFGFVLIYFSKSAYGSDDVVAMMSGSAPDFPFAACSTAGELTPSGLADGELIIILFPTACFQISACEIAKPDETNMEAVIHQVASHKNEFIDLQVSSPDSTLFALCLMDGMSYMEEAITAALHWGLDDINLLGGSAGDNLNFADTTLILNGEVVRGRAILILINSKLPTEIFKTENFVPTAKKLVVTHSDPDKRIVYEFNGANAAEVYADIIGADPKNLSPQSFASHPLVVRVGGEYYCRSIQKVNGDNSLTFFCAIDDGVVLTVAEPQGMARTTQEKMEAIRNNLGEIDFVLGFDCVLRQIDARNRQITHKISKIYQENNVIGFNTYGEQYRSMHLNQTLTGVAFGVSNEGKAG